MITTGTRPQYSHSQALAEALWNMLGKPLKEKRGPARRDMLNVLARLLRSSMTLTRLLGERDTPQGVWTLYEADHS